MKRSPLVPFGMIAGLAIILMIVIGIWGGNIAQERADKNNGASKGDTANLASLSADKIYGQKCSTCHGANLEGGMGPNLQKIGGQLSKDKIVNQIKNGGGGMPANVITGDAVDKVADWLSKKK
ncbi:mono/diheme cytochrome c family protein [Pullulanibacillus pueri]|uniref:Cytochrome c n=1 Tax=Pullulanibacillus pueri TaxID=1437324 RepID=A0A8J2ZYQ3_9BACL|nr:cytochrome c [Pullulanibacillus pueri]MBM7683031.1 mono/diheme cytochrome c family protein [Pullulanibacillus pueri]GGH85013.1 cytochrome c [Pullulanibacillus pueri]